MSPLILLALLAAQSADPGADLQPTTEAAIVAGGAACVGATVDPTGQTARLSGWQPVTPAQRARLKTDGDVVARDNVMLIYRTGLSGGCVVLAKPDAAFDATSFYARLGKVLGVPVVTGSKEPVTTLPSGEVMIVIVTQETGARLVTLVLGNPNAKSARGKDK